MSPPESTSLAKLPTTWASCRRNRPLETFSICPEREPNVSARLSGTLLVSIPETARGMAIATGSAISSHTGRLRLAHSVRVATTGVSGRSAMSVTSPSQRVATCAAASSAPLVAGSSGVWPSVATVTEWSLAAEDFNSPSWPKAAPSCRIIA